MNIKGILIAAALFGSFAAADAQQTKILTAEKHNEYGLVYSLPKTALQIDVTARKRTRIAGDFYQYAKKYIGTDRVITDNSEEWTITYIRATPYGVADTETQYLMQLKPGATTYMGVGDDGMLLSVNCKPIRNELPFLPEKQLSEKRHTGKEYLQYVNEDFLGSQSKAKQAEMLAASLMEVRDSYISLTRGTADNMPTDGKQLELMLSSLREQEKALTEAFTGLSYEDEESRSFAFTPGAEGRHVLFRLSSFAGFAGADDYSGDPVNVTVKIVRQGTLPQDVNGEPKKFPKDGIAYCLPGTARITVSFKGEDLFSHDYEMGQYGAVFGLNPQLFTSKKDPSYAVFSDVTGGLLEIGSVRNLKEETPTAQAEEEEAAPEGSSEFEESEE